MAVRGNESQDPAQGPEHPDSVDLFNTGISLQMYTNDTRISHNDILHEDAPFAIDVDETVTETVINDNILSSKDAGGTDAINDKSGKAKIHGNTGSGNNLIHTNGTSSYSGNSDSSGSSALGQIDLGLLANSLSSIGDGTGDAGGSESGDLSDLLASEISEISAKTLSGIYVPIAALILVLVFCFAFLGVRDEDEDE